MIDYKNYLYVDLTRQTLSLIENDSVQQTFKVSTGKNGVGEQNGSEKTPRGWHEISEKIGAGAPLNAVFVARQQSGEIYTEALFDEFPGRDWILTRIMWLKGLEPGKNLGGERDTKNRYIYIHGTPDKTDLGKPGSRGCIRMNNHDLIKLFDIVPQGLPILLEE